MLNRCIGEIKNDSGEASGLQQQVCSTEGLIETRPRLVFFSGMLTGIDQALTIRDIPATHPKHLIQANTVCRNRFGIKRIMCVDPCTDAAFCCSLCEERQRHARSSRGGGTCNLADRSYRKAAGEQIVDLENASLPDVANGARNWGERGRVAVLERAFDLQAKSGRGRHGIGWRIRLLFAY
jgi:hypothetical protein